MFKKYLFLALFSSHALCGDLVEIYATNMDAQDETLKANGDVVVLYEDYFLSAQSAIYDKKNGILELFGNIRANQGDKVKFLGEYAKMNMNEKERTIKPFFMLEEQSQVWLSGSSSYAKQSDLSIDSGMVSGCDPSNPLWKIEFTTSDYNTESMWLNLYNARIYLYDVPVFYTPYFGYSLDTARRTGVLPPMIGLSSKEGFYYEQALYIAEDNWWDLEIKPQLRTSRGSGVYSTFRFVDSVDSKGSFTAGYFKESQNYFSQNELANDKHYGFNLSYSNKDILNNWFKTSLNGQSGLYLDINDMNDVDYINLSSNDTTKNTTAQQLISRANLFYDRDSDYFGIYLKYYKDLSLASNDETIQTTPTMHYHSYLNTLFSNHLSYSFDIKGDKYYRKTGKTAFQTDINIPLTAQASFFDEYLNLSYKAYLYAQQTSFGAEEATPSSKEFSNGFFARNHHVLSLSSQLTAAHETITHTLDFGSQYVVDGSQITDGYYNEQKDYCMDSSHKSEEICQFYNISQIKDNLQLYFSQYVYDKNGNQIIYHRLSQSITYDGTQNETGDLENEFDYQITQGLNFYNNLFYSYDKNRLSKNFNKISLTTSNLNVELSHMYENKFLEESQNIDYLTSSLTYKYNKNYSYKAAYNHDLQANEKKGLEVGFMYERKCWDFGIRYVENNRPILKAGGDTESIYDRFIYFTIRLKPIMPPESKSSGFVYKLPER